MVATSQLGTIFSLLFIFLPDIRRYFKWFICCKKSNSEHDPWDSINAEIDYKNDYINGNDNNNGNINEYDNNTILTK